MKISCRALKIARFEVLQGLLDQSSAPDCLVWKPSQEDRVLANLTGILEIYQSPISRGSLESLSPTSVISREIPYVDNNLKDVSRPEVGCGGGLAWGLGQLSCWMSEK